MSRHSAFFGGGAIKLHSLSLHKFFLKLFGHGRTPGCAEMLYPSAFRYIFFGGEKKKIILNT